MKKPKLTQRFPRGVKPHHKGVYLGDRQNNRETYQHWNGRFWGAWTWSVKDANSSMAKNSRSVNQNPIWRGLAVKP